MEKKVHKIRQKMLTPEEVSKYLNVSMPTVYRYLNDKEKPLPSYKLTKKSIRIKKEDLENWIKNQEKISE